MTIRVMFMQSQSYFGADSRMHAQLMRYFDRREVQVHVACNSVVGSEPELCAIEQIRTIPDVHVRPTKFGPTVTGTSKPQRIMKLFKGSVVPISLLALAAYIRKHNIQIIHGTEKPRDAFYGVLLGKLTGAKSIVHMHVAYGEWQRPTVKWALRHADGVIGVSRFVADTIIRAGIPADRVFHIVNGLDLNGSRWRPGLDGAKIRKEFNIAADDPVIGIVARLFVWKGHGYLIEAVALVRKVIPNIRLMIVGEDDTVAQPGHTSFRAELEQQVKSLGLEDNVIFTGFRLDIPEVVTALDADVMPPWEEPCAIAFIEAMALAKPVIAWQSGGVPEMVIDGKTGILTEPRNVPALAEAIIKVLQDRRLREQYGAAGRYRVETYLSPERMCKDATRIYNAILSKSK